MNDAADTLTSQKLEEKMTEDFALFLERFNKAANAEEKIREGISFMKQQLSMTATPGFKDFWEARKLCQPLFKESISSWMRGDLWKEYIELSTEARSLKQIWDERSSFAFEQIELALDRLLEEIVSAKTSTLCVMGLENLQTLSALQAHATFYLDAQREILLLTRSAAKLIALRKEALKTEMRMKNKQKLFDKLSKCGDLLFPRKKELIAMISKLFVEDIEAFIALHYVIKAPTNVLRDEVKALQSLAKILGIHAHAFTKAREHLSALWDKIKAFDQERKQEFQEKRAEAQKHHEEFISKIEAFEKFCITETRYEEIRKAVDVLLLQLKAVDKAERKILQERIDSAKAHHEASRKQALEQFQEKEKEKEARRVAVFAAFRDKLISYLEGSLEALINDRCCIEEELSLLSCTKAEKAMLDRLFGKYKDRILQLKSDKLLALPNFVELQELLQAKKERRKETKQQIEIYRKALGGSHLDFEKAIECRELLEQEKEMLIHMDETINAIEDKMSLLE